MAIHREQCRVDARDVLDQFERWLLRERSAPERTAAAYTARVAGFAEWLPAPIDQSLRKLTAATVIEWVSLEAARGLKASTLGTQMAMLRPFLQFCHRSGRTRQDFSVKRFISVKRVEVFRLGGIETSILEDLDTHP